MKGLLQIGNLETKMPLVYHWLIHTEATRQLVEDNYSDLEKSDKLDMLVAENVLTQLENLRTYPAVRSMLHSGHLSLHGWIYNIHDGSILAYDSERHAFVPPFSNPAKTKNNGYAHTTHMPGEERLARGQSERIFKGSY